MFSHQANQLNPFPQTEQIKPTHHCHHKPRCEGQFTKIQFSHPARHICPQMSLEHLAIWQRLSGRDYLGSEYLAETDLSDRDYPAVAIWQRLIYLAAIWRRLATILGTGKPSS